MLRKGGAQGRQGTQLPQKPSKTLRSRLLPLLPALLRAVHANGACRMQKNVSSLSEKDKGCGGMDWGEGVSRASLLNPRAEVTEVLHGGWGS